MFLCHESAHPSIDSLDPPRLPPVKAEICTQREQTRWNSPTRIFRFEFSFGRVAGGADVCILAQFGATGTAPETDGADGRGTDPAWLYPLRISALYSHFARRSVTGEAVEAATGMSPPRAVGCGAIVGGWRKFVGSRRQECRRPLLSGTSRQRLAEDGENGSGLTRLQRSGFFQAGVQLSHFAKRQT